eukprot:3605841-Rhodomonas_salina.1
MQHEAGHASKFSLSNLCGSPSMLTFKCSKTCGPGWPMVMCTSSLRFTQPLPWNAWCTLLESFLSSDAVGRSVMSSSSRSWNVKKSSSDLNVTTSSLVLAKKVAL